MYVTSWHRAKMYRYLIYLTAYVKVVKRWNISIFYLNVHAQFGLFPGIIYRIIGCYKRVFITYFYLLLMFGECCEKLKRRHTLYWCFKIRSEDTDKKSYASHTYILTYLYTYILTYLLTYLHTYLHTYLLTYILTYLHTYILTTLV